MEEQGSYGEGGQIHYLLVLHLKIFQFFILQEAAANADPLLLKRKLETGLSLLVRLILVKLIVGNEISVVLLNFSYIVFASDISLT